MKKETNLCMSCMTPIPAGAALTRAPGECPRCNWIDNGVYLASYLYPKTFLAGRYIVGKLISYNGEGALYAGYDTLTEAKIIIKEYMPDALCTRARDVLPLSVNAGELPLYKTYLSEFIELNRSLQSFGSSPKIQKITDVFSENNTAYAVHEDPSGMSLAEFLRTANQSNNTLTPEQTKDLFQPVFAALGKINTAGIIHRGISPKTIFVSIENDVPSAYITDFAITAARIYGSKINSEVFAGYAAPEQHNWVERHGDWTDVYGFAALLYNVLTGIVPQDAPSRLEEDKLVEPMLVNGLIPVRISKAIMRGMELSAEKRVKTVDEFSRLLWSAGSGSGFSPATVNDTLAFTSTSALTRSGTKPASERRERNYGYNPESFAAFHSDGEYEAQSQRNARKRKRESRRKTAMIAALSTISAVVVLFLFFIIAAVVNPNLLSPSQKPDVTPAATTEPPRFTPPPEQSGDESRALDPLEEGQVTKFVGEKFNERWAREPRFDFLEFEFVAEFSDKHPKNTVFEQSIKQGDIVPFGTKIVIKYSLGPEYVSMPDYVIGQSVAELVDALIKKGVSMENIVELKVEYAGVIEGAVCGANIQPGMNIKIAHPDDIEHPGDDVIIYIATPPAAPPPFNPGRPGGGNKTR